MLRTGSEHQSLFPFPRRAESVLLALWRRPGASKTSFSPNPFLPRAIRDIRAEKVRFSSATSVRCLRLPARGPALRDEAGGTHPAKAGMGDS